MGGSGVEVGMAAAAVERFCGGELSEVEGGHRGRGGGDGFGGGEGIGSSRANPRSRAPAKCRGYGVSVTSHGSFNVLLFPGYKAGGKTSEGLRCIGLDGAAGIPALACQVPPSWP